MTEVRLKRTASFYKAFPSSVGRAPMTLRKNYNCTLCPAFTDADNGA